MKKIFSWLFMLMAIALQLASSPMTPPAQARTLRLFLIGNSFSQNASTYLPQIAREGGHELVIGRAEAPAYTLQQHWEALEAAEANPNDAKGKIYGGKSLRELLSVGTWDIVTIQQGSAVSGDLDSYRPYAQKLHDFIKKLQPNAEVVLHETWAYRSDAADFSVIAPGTKARTDREMWEKLLVAYHTTAAELGVRLIPVGDAFWRVNSDPRWGYKKDSKFDYAKPIFPDLPDQTDSLNEGYRWERQTKLGFDPRHANEAGKYLGGLVWYGVLFGESPEKVAFAPADIPAAFADHLRQVAAEVVLAAPLHNLPADAIPAAADATVKRQPNKTDLSTSQGKGADTSVRGGDMAARSFGHLDILRVRNSVNLGSARKAYLRFDLSALPQAVKGAQSVTLNLTEAPAEGNSPPEKVWTFQVHGLKDGTAGESWNESISWDNAPANIVQSPSALTADATPLGTFTIVGAGEAGKTVSFSSLELLKFLQSDSNGIATLIITRNEAGDSDVDNVVHIFASKENAALAAPTLTLNF